MPQRRRGPGAPHIRRVRVDDPTPSAYLWATYGNHMKAGVASLLPIAIVYFATQPLTLALTTLATGGFIILPAFVAGYSAIFALISRGVTHLLRRNFAWPAHYAAYAAAGAVALLLAAMLMMALVMAYFGAAPWEHPAWDRYLVWSPALGAVGALIGRAVLTRDLGLYEDVMQGPLPDVLKFETRKRDRDEWEQL